MDLFNFPFLISGVTFFVREKDTGAWPLILIEWIYDECLTVWDIDHNGATN